MGSYRINRSLADGLPKEVESKGGRTGRVGGAGTAINSTEQSCSTHLGQKRMTGKKAAFSLFFSSLPRRGGPMRDWSLHGRFYREGDQ